MIFLIRFVQNAVDIYSLILIVFCFDVLAPMPMNHVLDASDYWLVKPIIALTTLTLPDCSGLDFVCLDCGITSSLPRGAVDSTFSDLFYEQDDLSTLF